MQKVRFAVVSSCTSKKAVSCSNPLLLEDFQNPTLLRVRERQLGPLRLPAGLMYSGSHHRDVLKGVQALRASYGRSALALSFVSAGYGVVTEDHPIVPYNVSFSDMDASQATHVAQRLEIPRDIRRAIQSYPLVIFLLGGRYVRALDPPLVAEPDQRLVFVASRTEWPSLVGPRVTVVPAGKTEAREFGAGIIDLKGKMFLLFARGLAVHASVFDSVREDSSPEGFLEAVRLGAKFGELRTPGLAADKRQEAAS